VFAAALVILWYALARSGAVSPLILASPVDVAEAVGRLFSLDGVGRDLAVTGGRVGAALAAATGLGIPLGLLLGYLPGLYAYVERPIHALRSVPATALFPLLLIVVGVGEAAIVVLAAYPAMLVILVNTLTGVELANERRLRQARTLGLGAFAMIREVLVYEALPGIFNGVRTAVSYILVLVVAVEMFIRVGQHGLGRAIYDYQATYRIPETYAAIILAGTCGVVLNGLVTVSERRMLRWLPNATLNSM
jgi:ABC-type nitrate/sulfonate/bicarbonate transport system permease component